MNHWQPQPLHGSLPLPIFSAVFSDQVRFLAEDEKDGFIFFLVLMPSRCSLVSHLCTLAFKCSFFPFFLLCITCFSFFLFSSPSLSLALDSLSPVIRKTKQGYAIVTFTTNCCHHCCCGLCFITFFIILKQRFRV